MAHCQGADVEEHRRELVAATELEQRDLVVSLTGAGSNVDGFSVEVFRGLCLVSVPSNVAQVHDAMLNEVDDGAL